MGRDGEWPIFRKKCIAKRASGVSCEFESDKFARLDDQKRAFGDDQILRWHIASEEELAVKLLSKIIAVEV